MATPNIDRKKTISILGCGWYGLALAKKLIENDYKVKGSTTSDHKLAILKAAGIEPYLVCFEKDHIKYELDFFDCDLLLISIPPNSKSPSLADFPGKIKTIASAAKKGNVKQVIFISSTGIYANENFIVNENVIPNPDTDTGKILVAAEEVLVQNRFFTTTIIRFAGLIGPDRNLAKYFAGKKNIPNGLAPINLIHLSDCIGISLAIIKQQAFGMIYHGVTPSHPTRASFYTKNCLSHGLEKPHFINELLTWKQIESLNVPNHLAYQFKIADWNNLPD